MTQHGHNTAEQNLPPPHHGRPGSMPTAICGGFAFTLCAATLAGKVPLFVAAAYLILSAIAYSLYAIDKSAAREERRRIPERTLHLIALAGGWPGAILAQQHLRHKTVKVSFQLVFWLTVAFNCAALVWLSAAARSLRATFL